MHNTENSHPGPQELMAVFERRYLKKEFHPVFQRATMWGLLPGSIVSLVPVYLNLKYLSTCTEADRYRLEKMGMSEQAFRCPPSPEHLSLCQHF